VFFESGEGAFVLAGDAAPEPGTEPEHEPRTEKREV
jgi:hypothetical protein